MADSNADQIEFWTGAQGEKWARLQDGIDQMMAPFTKAGIQALGDITGARCLDIGCGAGATSLALAEKVGDGGSVAGIDVSTPMLARARERASTLGNAGRNLRFIEADAQSHDFAGETFDKFFSRFGVMFFHDPAAALGNLRSACAEGADFVAISWREPRENPWVMVPVSVAKDFVELPGRPAPDEPGQFQWADPDRVEGWMTGGGWRNVKVEPLDVALTFPGTPAEVAHYLLQMGPAASLLREAGGNLQEKAEAALTDKLTAHLNDGVVKLGAACWTVSATA